MSQALAKVIVHIVYSTKNREPWLKDPMVRSELYAYNATILKNVDSPAILINGVEDHLHLLCLLSRKFAIKDIIEESKTETSKWLKKQGAAYRGFHWQAGYGIFSISQSGMEQVKRYIAQQETHHRKMTFQDEFRKLCDRYELPLDERYVWD